MPSATRTSSTPSTGKTVANASSGPALAKRMRVRKPGSPPQRQQADLPDEMLASELEAPINILADLVSIAIGEVGLQTGRAISVLVAAQHFLAEIKAVNGRLYERERRKSPCR